MPASEELYNSLREQLKYTKDKNLVDEILDYWNKCTKLVTEWDAEQWGFNPVTWMVKERAQMERNIAVDRNKVRP